MKILRDRAKSVDLDEFLSRPLFGFLATASESGPRASPIWFLWEDEAIWMIGNRRTDSFPGRIEADARCAITFVDFDAASGRVHHVGMRGQATVVAWDEGRAKRILVRYLGPEPKRWDRGRFVEPLDDSDNILVRFTPDTVVARDQSYVTPPQSDLPGMPRALRQRAVLDDVVGRASTVDAIDGVIVIGSFAGGEPDALSDLDLLAVSAPGRLDEAWEQRHYLAGDAFLSWEPHENEGLEIRWFNWLTHDLVKVECGIAAPGSKELAKPFRVVYGPASLAERFPRIDMKVVEQRAAQRREQQRVFDPDELTPEERLGWKLSEMKEAARDVMRRGSARAT